MGSFFNSSNHRQTVLKSKSHFGMKQASVVFDFDFDFRMQPRLNLPDVRRASSTSKVDFRCGLSNETCTLVRSVWSQLEIKHNLRTAVVTYTSAHETACLVGASYSQGGYRHKLVAEEWKDWWRIRWSMNYELFADFIPHSLGRVPLSILDPCNN